MTNTTYKTEEPSYTDVIYERLEKKRRRNKNDATQNRLYEKRNGY